MRIDLHIHTSCSDGLRDPDSVVELARRASLDLIAITDHDTLAGVGPATAAAARLGSIRVIPAIELTCVFRGADLHLLGYAVDPGHPELAQRAASLAVRRKARIGEIVARLNALGVAIDVSDVTVPPGNAAVGRPHVAQALVRLGRVATIQEAFAQWLRDGGPAHVAGAGPDVAEGIAAVLAAGGCPVWAHPAPKDTRYFQELKDSGLVGAEAFRPSQPPADSAAIEQAAQACGLVVTGGSDWHGGPRPALGSWFVTEKHVAGFLGRIGILTD
jgi:predicted metal-dependent phosphoesterase TrpH